MCDDLRHILTAMMDRRATDNDNSRNDISELDCRSVAENDREMDMIGKQNKKTRLIRKLYVDLLYLSFARIKYIEFN